MSVSTKENVLAPTAVDIGGKNTPSLNCPHSRSRDHPQYWRAS